MSSITRAPLIDLYFKRGWHLVPLAPKQKRPVTQGWNKTENLVHTPVEGARRGLYGEANVGVHLAPPNWSALIWTPMQTPHGHCTPWGSVRNN